MQDEALRASRDEAAAARRARMEAIAARAAEEEAQGDTAAAPAPAQTPPDGQGNRRENVPGMNPLRAISALSGGADEAVVADVGATLPSLPNDIGHGVVDAYNATMSLVEDTGNQLARLVTADINPRLRYLDPETGNWDWGIIWTGEEAQEFQETLARTLGEEQARVASTLGIEQPFNEPDTVTGGLVEGMSQFLAGFALGGQALKAAGIPQGVNFLTSTGRAMLQGAIGDFTAFDGNEERLSNLIQEYEPLRNPVTEFLAADEDDPELAGRIKNVLEGAGLGVVADAFIGALRSGHAARGTRGAAEAELANVDRANADAAVAVERDIWRIGNPSAPPVQIMKEPGNMVRRMAETTIADIREGRRGLDPQEAEHLLGAADRWAAAVRRTQPVRGLELEDRIAEARARVDQGEYDLIMDLMEEARRPTFNAPSLFDEIREMGGLRLDEGGELANMDLRPRRYRNGQLVSTNKGSEILDENTGTTLDDAALALWERGYFPDHTDRPSINDLLELIRREAGGDRIYSRDDFDAVFEERSRRDAWDELERIGADPNQPIAGRRSQAEELAAIQEGEPVTLRDLESLGDEMDEVGAGVGIKAPTGDLLGGQDVRINFNALQGPDDIRSIIGQLADAFRSEIENARGGVRGNDVVIKDRRTRSAWDALNNRRAGEPLKDSDVLAAQSLYLASGENVRDALSYAAQNNTPEAHFAARRALAIHRTLQAEIAGAKADAGRSLRAWGLTARSDALAQREMQNILDSHGGNFTPEELSRLRQMAETNPESLDRVVRWDSWQTAVAEIGADILRMAYLSGPQTHMMNMAGNSLTMMFDTLPRFAAAGAGRLLGDAVVERQLGAALAEYGGFMAGIRSQFSAFARSADYGRMGRDLREIAARSGERGLRGTLMDTASSLAINNPVSATFRGRFDDMGVSGRKFAGSEYNRSVSAERFGQESGSPMGMLLDGVGRILSAPTDFLGFQDDFFKGVNYLGSMHRQAYEIASRDVPDAATNREAFQNRYRQVLEDPTPEMIGAAKNDAQRRTFTEPVGPMTKGVMTVRRGLNGLGLPFGHVLLPFVVTPSNILKYAFTNSPAGVVFRSINEDLQAGGERRAVAQGRLAAGTGLLMIGMDMAANGQITGAAPSDSGERALWDRMGIQEYSIRSGDKWISYRRLEPVSTMIAIGADLRAVLDNITADDATGVEIEDAILSSVGAAVSVVTNKTYLTGVSEFIQFSEDPQRDGGNYLRNVISSVAVPTGISQIERAIDPEIRDAQSLVDRIRARLPYFSQDLPQQYDLWGRAREFQSGVGRTYDALSPFAVRTQDPEPIDTELRRIGYYPRLPARNISVPIMAGPESGLRVGINLSNRPDIYARYVQLAGNEGQYFGGMGTRDFLNAVIEGRVPASAAYASLDDSATSPNSRERFIGQIITESRNAAQAQLFREFGPDLQAMALAAQEAQRLSEARRASQLEAQQ